MPKIYNVLVPYCCSVNIRVAVDEEIENPEAALDAAMMELDRHDACLMFVKGNGMEVDQDKVSIGEGEFLRSIVSGNVLHASFNEIDWEEADG